MNSKLNYCSRLALITSILNPYSAAFAGKLFDGSSNCLNLQEISQGYESLPSDYQVRKQTLTLTVQDPSATEHFKNKMIDYLYESSTQKKALFDDHSVTIQDACQSVRMTYQNGRSDDYKIISYTPTSLTLESTAATHDVIYLEAVSKTRIISGWTTSLGMANPPGSTTQESHSVFIQELFAWDPQLPEKETVPFKLLEQIKASIDAQDLRISTTIVN